MRTVWILGDQLHEDHPALARADPKTDRVLFIESRKRSEQVCYHQLKLVLIFSAMRHRAEALRISELHLSISHCRAYATAYAIAVRADTTST